MDLSKKRIAYNKGHLTESQVNASPFVQFDEWMKEALKAEIKEPYAMSLATSSMKNEPSVRTVLLRYYDNSGLVFYTNYNSLKGKELNDNPKAAILFFWPDLERQIRIKGAVTKVSASVSDEYWNKRPELSRLASKSSAQSAVISSAKELEDKMTELKASGDLSRPSHWGGYLLEPHYFEFWQGRPGRMHDRISYHSVEDSDWEIQRLAP